MRSFPNSGNGGTVSSFCTTVQPCTISQMTFCSDANFETREQSLFRIHCSEESYHTLCRKDSMLLYQLRFCRRWAFLIVIERAPRKYAPALSQLMYRHKESQGEVYGLQSTTAAEKFAFVIEYWIRSPSCFFRINDQRQTTIPPLCSRECWR